MTDETCGFPGPGGMGCTMPRDHPGNSHAYTMELPPDVARVVGQMMEANEAREAALDKALRYNRRFMLPLLYVATAMNVLGAINGFFF